MDNENLSCEISRDSIVYTLMRVSHLDSTSSSSLEQSISTINKAIDCEESCPAINNTDKQSHICSDSFSIDATSTARTNLGILIKKKLLHLNWTNYIHWKPLLTSGFALWIALCIADKRPHHFPTSRTPPATIETEYDEDVYYESTQETSHDSHVKWYHNPSSLISWINQVPNTAEACVLSSFMILIIFIEFRLRNYNTRDKLQESCHECQHDPQRLKLYEDKFISNKLSMEKLKTEKGTGMYDELGNVLPSKNQLHTVKIVPYERMDVDPDSLWELKMINSRNHHEIKHNIKRNDNKHFNKSGIESNVGTNIDRSSWNKDDHVDVNNVVNNDYWKLNSQNFRTYNCDCSLPYYNYNPVESINVNSTYDTEIYKYIMSKCNTSTTEFEEITDDLWNYKNNIGRRKNQNDNNYGDNDDLSSLSRIKKNKNNDNRIISSSPAFKKFLSGLKNSPTAFNRRTWIHN